MGIEAFGLRPSHPLCYAMLCYALKLKSGYAYGSDYDMFLVIITIIISVFNMKLGYAACRHNCSGF